MSKSSRYKKICTDLDAKIKSSYSQTKIQLYSYVRLGLLAKYTKSIKAIYWLDIKGFFEDSNIILRTIFEIFITIMYCENNPKDLYKRFYEYNAITRLKYMSIDDELDKIIKVIYKNDIQKLSLKKQEFMNKYNIKKVTSWNNLNIFDMCKKLDKQYKTSFYSDMYAIIYRDKSEYIHSNITCILEDYIRIENHEIKINANPTIDENYDDIIVNLESLNEKLLNISFS